MFVMKLACTIMFILVIDFCSGQTGTTSPVPIEADSLFFNLKYKEAVSSYTDFINENPNAANASYARLAFSNHFTGNYTEAIKGYNLLLTRNPTKQLKAILFSRMAMTYSMKKEKQKAIEYLDSANANGYINTYELEHFADFAFIRNETRFNQLYEEVYKRSFPCKTRPEARQFDFWIGEWDVYLNAYPHHRVGSSVIQNVSGECTILENWQSFNNPFTGKSQNWFDPNTKKWSQLWVGSGGGSQLYTDGEYSDGAMRFKYVQPDGKGYMQPGNFFFYNLGPDLVRQYQELSADSGKTFTVVYDFLYKRRRPGTSFQADGISDEEKIININRRYIDYWLLNDENGVMSLFTEDAMISPSGMKTIKGKQDIKNFWFPKDGSVTTIVGFSNDIQHISFDGEIAYSTQFDHLTWTYKSKEQQLNREQSGITTTIYKKQQDGDWKIIHQMWKDYKVVDKKVVD